MKKLIGLLIASLFIIGLVACGNDSQTEESLPSSTEAEVLSPADFSVYGIKLGGLNKTDFEETFTSGIAGYELKVTVDEDTFPIPAESMGLKTREDFKLDGLFEKVVNGEITAQQIEEGLLVIGDDDTIKQSIIDSYSTFLEYELQSAKAEADTNAEKQGQADSKEIKLSAEEVKKIEKKVAGLVDATKAKIKFDKNQGKFIGVDGTKGQTRDYTASIPSIKEAALVLAEGVTIKPEVIYSEGEKATGNAKIENALKNANAYFELKIVYNFKSPTGKTGSYTIDKSNINSFLYVGSNGLDIYIDKEDLSSKSVELADKYTSLTTTESKTDKELIKHTVGYRTSRDTIYNNILNCLTNKKSGTFNATFEKVDETKKTNLSEEVYVYVNLDAQRVTLYKGKEVLMTCSCVSGKVSNNHITKEGTFNLYYKARDCVLRGPGYASHVDYWMPFCGGIGLHDASWRDEFGGDIYLRDGSHGCVNLPTWAAKKIYENVKAGTRVVVVGGAKKVPQQNQSVTYSKNYTLNVGDSPLKLSVSVKGGAALGFEVTGDKNVIKVSSDGYVTPLKAGTSKVKVNVFACTDYKATSVEISITVKAQPPTQPTQPTQPPTTPSTSETESTSPSTSETESTTGEEQTDPTKETTDPATESLAQSKE